MSRLAWLAIIAVTLSAWLACSIDVGLSRHGPPGSQPTSMPALVDLDGPVVDIKRPVVEISRGDTAYDPWLPYAMVAAAVLVLLFWGVPPWWPIRKRCGRPNREE